jgi:hypothetical protein
MINDTSASKCRLPAVLCGVSVVAEFMFRQQFFLLNHNYNDVGH